MQSEFLLLWGNQWDLLKTWVRVPGRISNSEEGEVVLDSHLYQEIRFVLGGELSPFGHRGVAVKYELVLRLLFEIQKFLIVIGEFGLAKVRIGL